MAKEDGFNEWCIVELLGHRRVAGLVSEASVGGCSLLRVDVPECPERAAMTQYYGPGAIYCMTPVTEVQARAAARAFAPLPVSRWELAQCLPPPGADGAEAGDEDDFPDEDDDPFREDAPPPS